MELALKVNNLTPEQINTATKLFNENSNVNPLNGEKIAKDSVYYFILVAKFGLPTKDAKENFFDSKMEHRGYNELRDKPGNPDIELSFEEARNKFLRDDRHNPYTNERIKRGSEEYIEIWKKLKPYNCKCTHEGYDTYVRFSIENGNNNYHRPCTRNDINQMYRRQFHLNDEYNPYTGVPIKRGGLVYNELLEQFGEPSPKQSKNEDGDEGEFISYNRYMKEREEAIEQYRSIQW